MRTALFGLFLAAAATGVYSDDYDNDNCRPESSYAPPDCYSRLPSLKTPSFGDYAGTGLGKSYSRGYGDGDSSSSGGDYASQGGSPLGTFNTPDNRQQWGEYDIDTDYNFIVPDTGVIREVRLETH